MIRNLKNRKLYIFDMDGTLIDSVGIWNQVDEALIRQISRTGEEIRDIQKKRDEKLREYTLEKDPYLCYCAWLKQICNAVETVEEIHHLRYVIADKCLREKICYKPNAENFLHALKAEGKTLVIATTTRRKNMDIYRNENLNLKNKANLDDYFETIYTREDTTKLKPDPEIYLRLLEEYGHEPQEALIFEDSLIGVEAARRAGIEVMAIYDFYAEQDKDEIKKMADGYVLGFQELLNLLEDE